MRARFLWGPVGLVCALSVMAPAKARHVRHVDMTKVFNADVIVNGSTPVGIDDTQKPVDQASVSFITQDAAQVLGSCTADPDGLPNDGAFAKTKIHPIVKLAYKNAADGRNAWRASHPGSFRVPVPQRRYRAMHVFATTGDGSSNMKIKLLFTTGDPIARRVTVPDWFDENDDGYDLIDGRDRGEPDGTQCYNEDAAAIFGFKVPSDAQRRLKAVKIIRTDDKPSVLNVFGMTGRRTVDHEPSEENG